MPREHSLTAVGLWAAILAVGLLPSYCVAAPGPGLGPPPELLPRSTSVDGQVQANVDPTPEKEWLVACNGPAMVSQHFVVVLRKTADRWIKLQQVQVQGGGISRLECRELDGDGMLEVIVWSDSEDGWGFDTLDSVDGRLHLVEGLDFSDVWEGTEADGFFDLDGDGKLELVATAMIPGYLTAMYPTRKWAFSPNHAPETSDRDVRIYRFVKGSPVLYFPPPTVIPRGLNAGLVSGYPESRRAAAAAAGVLGVSETLPRLLALLRDPQEQVACAAVQALARIGGPLAVAGVAAARDDARQAVAEAARMARSERDGDALLRPLVPPTPPVTQLAPTGALGALRARPPDEEDADAWGATVPPDWPGGPGEGWFRKTARRLGQPAIPVLLSRLKEVGPCDPESERHAAGYQCGCVAIASAHALREMGAVEAIPDLLQVSASHPHRVAREVAAWAVVALRRQGSDPNEPLFRQIEQKPLADYLGPGGPWRVVRLAVGNLDRDPEAELVIAYRGLEPGGPDALEWEVRRVAVLDWREGKYALGNSLDYHVLHSVSLRLQDLNGDGVLEAVLRGSNGEQVLIYARPTGGVDQSEVKRQ